eukprot:701280-Prymnesium_polylepis.1
MCAALEGLVPGAPKSRGCCWYERQLGRPVRRVAQQRSAGQRTVACRQHDEQPTGRALDSASVHPWLPAVLGVKPFGPELPVQT